MKRSPNQSKALMGCTPLSVLWKLKRSFSRLSKHSVDRAIRGFAQSAKPYRTQINADFHRLNGTAFMSHHIQKNIIIMKILKNVKNYLFFYPEDRCQKQTANQNRCNMPNHCSLSSFSSGKNSTPSWSSCARGKQIF